MSQSIVIGSEALKFHGYALGRVSDIDLMISLEDVVLKRDSKPKIDCIQIPTEIFEVIPNSCGIATLDALYTIKLSHLNQKQGWNKHIRDAYFLYCKGTKLVERLYKPLREYFISTIDDKSYLSLKNKSKDFFNDFVDYKYDHDLLHKTLSYPEEPMYKKCLKDGQEVLTDYNKFSSMCHSDKVKMLKEEIAVISFERFIVHDPHIHLNKAWMGGLFKMFTSISKGKTNNFLVKNFHEFYRCDFNMLNKLKRGIL